MISTALEIRPSAFERLSLCPGSAHMEAAVRALTGDDSTPEAELGTKIHAAVSAYIDLALRLGHPIDAAYARVAEDHPLDAWSMALVRRCVEFAHALVAKYETTPDNILVEHHLDMTDLSVERGGTADLILVDPFKRVVVVDWKCGFLLQDEADRHDQTAVYAVAAARTFKCNEVQVYLFQPRADESERASAAVFNAGALKFNESWVRSVAAQAQDPDAELRPSFNACKFCKALGVCPAAKEMVMRASEALANGIVPTSADEWGDLCLTAKLAGKFSDAAEKLVKDRLKAGEPVSGWEIGPGSVEKVIEDAATVYARMQGLGETYAKGFWEAVKVSRPELDKQCGGQRTAYADLLIERQKAGSLRQVKGGK